MQEDISTVNHDYELLGITLCPKMMIQINLLAVYKNPEGKVSKLLDCLLEISGRLNRSRYYRANSNWRFQLGLPRQKSL